MKKIDTLKLSVIITDIFMIILVGFCIGLPWFITWYAEVMNRSSTLAATVMITCYPCAPFAATLLFLLRKLLKNIIAEQIFTNSNVAIFKKMIICCMVISFITLIAGKFYMPFLIVGATFAFLSLLLYSLKGIFAKLNLTQNN